jgi:hypothetical protein
MEPYEQGALDSLCGVYSIINATRKIVKINEQLSTQLFKELIDFLEEKCGINRIIIDGIGLHDISQVLNYIIKPKYQIEAKAPFWHYPDTTLETFWKEMNNFLKPNTAILLWIGGKIYDHWSVVESISEKQIRLFDSCRIKQFNRNRCTTKQTSSKRMHQLFPTHTYFLRSSEP